MRKNSDGWILNTWESVGIWIIPINSWKSYALHFPTSEYYLGYHNFQEWAQ